MCIRDSHSRADPHHVRRGRLRIRWTGCGSQRIPAQRRQCCSRQGCDSCGGERRRRGHATHHPADSRTRHAQTHSRPRTTEAAGFVRSPAAAPTRDMHTDRGRHDQRGNRPQTGTGARDDTTNHQSNPLHLATA